MSASITGRGPRLEQSMLQIFGNENGQIGLMASHKITDEQLVQMGAAANEKMGSLDTSNLKPSADLFKTRVYSLHDKTPEQLAVDLKAIRDRIAQQHEAAFQEKVESGEALRIDLRGKTLEEVDLMNKQLSTEAAKRHKREQEFSDNPIISVLDSVSEAAGVSVSYGKKAMSLIKENPGKSIAGASAAFALWKMFDNDGEGIDIGKLLLIGLALVIGSAWMYDQQPKTFNNLANAFGLDSFFNQAPTKPMLKPGLGDTIGSFFGMDSEKFGDASAESAGSATTDDARLVTATASKVESWNRKVSAVQPSVKSRNLS